MIPFEFVCSNSILLQNPSYGYSFLLLQVHFTICQNFFGTLKCECLNRMQFANRDEVEVAVAEYMQFYNFERINMENGLTPDEIRSKAA